MLRRLDVIEQSCPLRPVLVQRELLSRARPRDHAGKGRCVGPSVQLPFVKPRMHLLERLAPPAKTVSARRCKIRRARTPQRQRGKPGDLAAGTPQNHGAEYTLILPGSGRRLGVSLRIIPAMKCASKHPPRWYRWRVMRAGEPGHIAERSLSFATAPLIRRGASRMITRS